MHIILPSDTSSLSLLAIRESVHYSSESYPELEYVNGIYRRATLRTGL